MDGASIDLRKSRHCWVRLNTFLAHIEIMSLLSHVTIHMYVWKKHTCIICQEFVINIWWRAHGAVAEWVRALAWAGDRTVSRPGSNPATVTSLQNFGNSVYPALPVSFGGDTKSRRSLLSGVYARGSKRSHQSALECVTVVDSTTHSKLPDPQSAIMRRKTLPCTCIGRRRRNMDCDCRCGAVWQTWENWLLWNRYSWTSMTCDCRCGAVWQTWENW